MLDVLVTAFSMAGDCNCSTSDEATAFAKETSTQQNDEYNST
jgi:hypothetical protein